MDFAPQDRLPDQGRSPSIQGLSAPSVRAMCGQSHKVLLLPLAPEQLSQWAQFTLRGNAVVGDCMRQDHSVRFSMGQIKTTTQRVAELVVQCHADLTQHRSAQPCAIERFTTRLEIGRIFQNTGQGIAKGPQPFKRHQRGQGVRFCA